ncbi:MAG: hypothetical protein JNM84_25890 [Planctomycetes bacterium]|nr:hypothetical protein [Planctomycetota bacterium]
MKRFLLASVAAVMLVAIALAGILDRAAALEGCPGCEAAPYTEGGLNGGMPLCAVINETVIDQDGLCEWSEIGEPRECERVVACHFEIEVVMSFAPCTPLPCSTLSAAWTSNSASSCTPTAHSAEIEIDSSGDAYIIRDLWICCGNTFNFNIKCNGQNRYRYTISCTSCSGDIIE